MKPMKRTLMIGTLAILFLFSTSAWADGRTRGGHHKGGHGYHQGYKKHHGQHYRRGHDRHYRSDYRHHRQYQHRHPAPRYHRPHRHYSTYYPSYGYGLHFSIFDPHFSFGISTGGYR